MKTLPYTPAEVLDISTAWLRFKMNAVVKLAELTGFWKRPFQKAATDFEEMTLPDIYYWVYKCINPIADTEKGQEIAGLLKRDQSIIKLPQGFTKYASVTLGAAGDLLQAEGLELSRDKLFENVSELIFDKDISYANFESPVTTQELKKEVIGDKEAPIECCSKEQFDVLTSHKGKYFTVLNTANNHILDMGIEGIETTLNSFAERNILDVGTNETPQEQGKAKILIKNGIKIGFTSVTFGLNGHKPPQGEEYRINTAKLLSKFADPDMALAKQQIDDCKAQGCDFIIASLHWGYEFEFFPRKKQVETARALAEYGADAILCHHPHVIQPVEYYLTKRDPSRAVVIAYSLGSVTWGYTAPHIVLSIILNLKLAKGYFSGVSRTYIEEAQVTPVFRSVTQTSQGLLSCLERLEDHADGSSTIHSEEYIATMKRYADLVLGDYNSANNQNLEQSTQIQRAA